MEAHPNITVELREFEHISGATNGIDRIYLDPRLLQVERRCTLTHELVHIGRQHTRCQPLTIERQVRHTAARLLVNVQDLRRELRWARNQVELAAELVVTPRVLSDRLECLTVSEMAWLQGAEVDAYSV